MIHLFKDEGRAVHSQGDRVEIHRWNKSPLMTNSNVRMPTPERDFLPVHKIMVCCAKHGKRTLKFAVDNEILNDWIEAIKHPEIPTFWGWLKYKLRRRK